MERQPHGEVRTPTHHWAGLALSKTSPSVLETAGLSQWAHRDENFPYKLGSTTSMLDSTPTQDRVQLSQFKDIHSLLTHLKLDHYLGKCICSSSNFLFASIVGRFACPLSACSFVGYFFFRVHFISYVLRH